MTGINEYMCLAEMTAGGEFTIYNVSSDKQGVDVRQWMHVLGRNDSRKEFIIRCAPRRD